MTPELATGNLVHETLANIFELPEKQRRLDHAQHLFRELWRKQRRSRRYGHLFGLSRPDDGSDDGDEPREYADVERERAWGLRAFETLRSYFELEDPSVISPVACEERVAVSLSSGTDSDSAIPLTGVMDRLDMAGSGGLVVIDYKTGRSPGARWRDTPDLFFQLEMYALLLREAGRPVDTLRLLYLGDGKALEKPVDVETLAATEATLRAHWSELLTACRDDTFEPTTSPYCDFCTHRSICHAWTWDGEGRAWTTTSKSPQNANRKTPGGPGSSLST
jgi:putative RecB family exonuclease